MRYPTLLRITKFVGLLMALIMSASLWFYVERILIPHQQHDAALLGQPRGLFSDLYPRWLGTRALLLEHRDPYSDEVTREIQQGYYGRVLDPNRVTDPKDQQRFVYPVYVAFILFPLAELPFSTARLVADGVLALLTGASVFLWLQVLRWRPPALLITVLVLLTLNSLPVVQGIKLEQLSLLVGALLALGAACVVRGYLAVGGVLLALATIKPQLVLLPVIFLLLWSFSGWNKRQSFFWGFSGCMVVLFTASHFVLPGWFPKFLSGLRAYQRYTGGSLLEELAGHTVGWLLAIAAIVGAGILCWGARKHVEDSPAFYHAFALVLAITVVIVPMAAPYNQVLLLPPIFLLVRSWPILWNRSRLSRMVCGLASLSVFWPWLAALALTLASLVLPAAAVQRGWSAPFWTSLVIPLIVPALLLSQYRSVSAKGGELEDPV